MPRTKKKKKPSKNVVYFSITGEFVTQHARILWAELSIDKAMRFLVTGISGMDEGTAVLICTGKRKLVGESCGPDSKPLELEQDNAQFDNRSLPLFTLEQAARHLHKQASEAKLGEILSRENLERFAEKWGRPIAEKVVEWNTRCQGEPTKEDEERAAQIARGEMLSEAVEQVMPLPKPERGYQSECGWIAPDGDFFGCNYGQHIWLASQLGKTEWQLEKAGWVKVSSEYILMGEKNPSQAQISTTLEFCQLKEREVPFWVKEVE